MADTAALGKVPNIALVNVVGSNVTNILLIIGLAASLTPVSTGGREIKRDALALLLACIELVALSFNGEIGRSAGMGMVAALIAYLTYAFFAERRKQKKGEELLQRVERDVVSVPSIGLSTALIFSLMGLVLLAGGAYDLVEGANASA